MSTPSEFNNEINVLTREFARQNPTDILQFCANHFLKRLEAQRAEFLITGGSHTHQAGHMAESAFPGKNPFGSRSGSAATAAMGSLAEESHDPGHDVASPTAAHFKNTFDAGSDEPSFGSTGFMSGNRMPPIDGSGSLPQNYNFNRRTSVSAESMVPGQNSGDWKAPFHPKTAEQEARLRQAVAPNFLFSHLDDEQTQQVLGALQEKLIPAKGIKVIQQGDAGDFFYVVEKGQFTIHVSPTGQLENGPDGMGQQVAEIGPGGSFGELALMYNAPRAATVVSTESSTLWALDRVTFRRIIMDSAFQRRQLYESFLKEVPLLETLTDYERSKIADALNTQKWPSGHTIIQEGDIGESFFLVESGEAEVFKRGNQQAVARYRKGDYFGELALLNDKPRAASVVSRTEIKLATLGKEGFQRLLGPVESIMRRNDPSVPHGDDVGPHST